MENRTERDLASVTARMRLFSGRPAQEIAETMPLLPVDAPGLAVPGAGLIQTAYGLGDPTPDIAPKKKGSKLKAMARPNGTWLTALVRSCLYQDGTQVICEYAGNKEPQEFQAGILMTKKDEDLYGPGPCRLMVVGKCLGATEVNGRRPFLGRGSKPLWDAWTEAGLPKAGPALPTFLTNLIRFSPPLAALTRLPKDWINDGIHLLHQEIAFCRPEVILVLGAEALKAVLGRNAKISDYRGRTGEFKADFRAKGTDEPDLFSCKVVASDHPAAVSRDPDKYPALLASMRYLGRQLGFVSEAASVALDHKAVYTLQELEQAVRETEEASKDGGYVSFDCEWEGRHPEDPGAYLYTLQWSHAPGHARVVFVHRCGGAPNASLPMDKALPLLKRVFERAPERGARLTGHFAKADLPWLYSVGVDLYPHYVGPSDDPVGTEDPLTAEDKCYFEGAFDTYVGAHAVEESAALKLEVLAANLLGIERYDVPIMEWRDSYIKEQGLKKSDLKGYGNIPEAKILPYASMDADVTGRLMLHLNGDPRKGTRGTLDADRYGNSSRKIFATRMRAWAAIAEMERYGLLIDRDQHRELRDIVAVKKEELVAKLRSEDFANWADFTPSKRTHLTEFLFGEAYSPKGESVRPQGAVSLYLEPYKATKASGGKLWKEALFRYRKDGGILPTPAADKETLTMLSRGHQFVSLLLDIKFLETAQKIIFRKPDEVVVDETDEEEDGGEEKGASIKGEVYSKGIISNVNADGRVRSRFGFVETGRLSSSAPNLQNVSDRVDEKYERIMGWGKKNAPKDSENAKKSFKTRSIFKARDGWYLVSADLKGAEIAAAAWSSGDKLLIDHAARSALDESDPNYLDLHSDLANTAFGLNLPLAEVKEKHKALRVAAKAARFGHYYGAGPETILRAALLESPDVSLEQVEGIVFQHDKMYPALARFFASCRERVSKPGWLRNGFGGMRRFRPAQDRDLLAGQERESQNWSGQGLVADTVAMGMGNIWEELRARKMKSRIVLSVHDSVMLECPPEEVRIVAKELLQTCMCDRVPVVVTTHDGYPLQRGPYHFSIDVGVYRNWGVECLPEEWDNEKVTRL